MVLSKIYSVLLVGPVAPPIGGMSRWTDLVSSELDQQKVPHQTVNTSPKRRRLDGQTRFEQVFGGIQNTLRVLFSIVKGRLRLRAKVVHLSTSGGLAHFRDILVVLVAKLMWMRVFVHIHHGRLPAIIEQRSFERLCIGILCYSTTGIILLDEPSQHALQLRWKNVVTYVVPNPARVPEPIYIERSVEKKTLLYLGWITTQKGIEDLLEVWSQLTHKRPRWYLELVGGISEEYRQDLSDRYPVERWSAHGEVSHPIATQILAEADILVLPSHSEGFPNVVLEAMALGVPVVATKVGAIPEMLAGGAGKLVSAKNKSELGTALSELMDDEEQRLIIGKRGYARVRDSYDVSIVVKAYRDIWRALI